MPPAGNGRPRLASRSDAFYNRQVWTRLIGALVVGLAGFLLPVWRVVRQLLHETAGAFFLLFALVGATSLWREWRRGSALWLLALAATFTVMMAAFAVASFRSARRVK